ncbi:MAG TPA: SDR family NAD(P)-dependent oxidoreductase [Myxococcota bacterium]|nr:SDR family NAD(P)-dependent oxidoreductase [Myxococcota bacterium]
MQDVAGRVAVITGGASGIGRGMAEAFGAAGMRLVLADVDEARVTETARALEKDGVEVVPMRCDVARQSDVDALAQRALDRFGAVHVVCNNAGVAHGGVPTWESTLHDWEWIVGVNLMGVVHGVRTFTPILLEEGAGHIVNTASMAGLISGAGNALYGVTKHAVVALSEALYNELAAVGRDVHVSVLCPGWINTEILRSSERNQPEAVRHSRPEVRTTPDSEIRRKQVEHLLASGLAPRKVGDLVLAAIRENRFWILTHPEWKGAIRHRLENVLEERAPTPAPPRR